MAIATILSGLAGYSLGLGDRVLAKELTWTEQEIRPGGTQYHFIARCLYHISDGTTRVRDTVFVMYGVKDPAPRCGPPPGPPLGAGR